MGLVTRDQLPFNPLDRTQKKWHIKNANDNLISIWTNTMVEIRDHASVSRQKCPRGSKLFRPRRFECCLGPRLKGLKSKVIFLGWKGGVVCPAQNLCVSQSGSDCCSCRCILQGMIQNSISCWLRTDRAKQTWTGNWVKFTSTLNEFVMKGQFFTDFNYRNSKTFFIACFNIPN